MKNDFKFESNGFDYKAEFEGLYKSAGRTEKAFHFYRKVGGAWLYQGCIGFPEKFTRKQIVESAVNDLL